MKWLIIFAIYSYQGGPKSLEYRALATEKECIEIGERAIKRNEEFFKGIKVWAAYHCVEMRKLLEAAE